MSEETSAAPSATAAEVLEAANAAPSAAEQVESLPQEVDSSESSKAEPDLSSKFAALSRKEKAIRDRESEFENRVKQWEAEQEAAKQAALEQKEPEIPLEIRLKKDPIGTLKELGYDYNALTELAVNDGKLTPEMQIRLLQEELSSKDEQYNNKIEEQIKQLRDEYLADKEAQAEQQYENEVQNYIAEINNVINSSDKYELTKAEDGSDLVFEVVEQHFKNTQEETGTGEILPIEDALEYVENFLFDQYKERLGNAKKLKELFGQQQAPQAPQTPQRKTQITLSNTLDSEVPTRERRPMSEDDYKRQAAAALKFME